MKKAGLFLAAAICEQSGRQTTAGVIAGSLGRATKDDMRASRASRGHMLFRVTKRLLCPLLVLFCVAFCAQNAQGQCTSLASGNWNDGTKWSCGHQPTSADGAITVASGHTMTVTAAVTVDQVTVNAGGQITVNSGVTLTVNNGAGTDLAVNGTVSVDGAIATTGVVGTSFSVSGTLTVGGSGSLTMSQASSSLTVDSGGVTTVDGSLTINNTSPNFTVNSGGSASVAGSLSLSGGNPSMTVNGSLSVTGTGSVTLASVSTVTVTGTITMSGSSSLSVTRGNGGALVTANSGGQISMTGTSQIIGGATNNSAAVVLTMNSGSTLIMGPSSIVGGPGRFDLASGASMQIGSTAGITSAGATGNVQVSSTRTYSSGANYTYNGTAAQVTGVFTTTPTANTVTNLTVNNSAGVTLSGNLTVAGILTLSSGDITTGSFALTQTGGTSAAGLGDVVGNVARTDMTVGVTRQFGNANVKITAGTGDTITSMTVNLVKNPAFTGAVKRTYNITTAGGVTTNNKTIRLHYSNVQSDLNGNVAANLKLFRGLVSGSTTIYTDLGATSRVNDTNPVTDASYVETTTTGFSPWATSDLVNAPTDIAMVGYGASHTRDGKALLQWETGREVNNLGFNVYREEAGKRVRVNKSLIVGSGLTARPGTVMSAGRSYAWMTSAAQAKESVFWIEEIDFSGRTVWHGPIHSQESAGGMLTMSAKQQAILEQTSTVSDLATESANAGVTRPVETLANTAKPGAVKITGAVINPQTVINPFNSSVKISLKQEGWYRIGQPQLVAAGLNPSVDPNSLQLFADGAEVPMSVITNNGAFDSTSAIEFYGLGIDTPSTDTHVYTLTAGISGKRIQGVTGKGGLPPANSFLYTVERKDRSIYVSGVHNGDAENFFGSVVSSSPTNQALTLTNVDATAAGQATIEVGMQGLSLTPHVVTVNLNGNPIGTISYDSQAQGVSQFTVPNSSLVEGQNLVTLSGQQGVFDLSLVDHIRVSYWHAYAADGNALKFTATANQQVTLAGFTSADVKVLDVTNPNVPSRVEATVTSQKSSPAFVVTVAVPGTGTRTLLAIGDDQTRSPLGVVADKATTWKSKSNAADLVIITHDSVKESFKQLQALRQSQGLKVALVDVEDIYDEFNFGNKSPQAIKDFLAYAKTNWKTAPKYVLLAGSASYDPKNYNGLGGYDLVPTKLIDTSFSETASDDWFADFNLDGIAEMAVGRLPVPSSEEAATTVTKLLVYENSESSNSALLVADGNQDFDFEAANASLAALFPGSITVQQIDRGQIGTAAARQQLLDGIASGQKIVNYVGHGSPSAWRDNLLTAADASALTNTGRYPVFISMTCLNGEFQHPELNTLAAALMNSREGGAVAVWASSGFTVPPGQAVMNQQFYTLLFQSNQPAKGKAPQAAMTLGEITTSAKSSVSDPDIRRTWILFGDPSMRVK